MPWIEPWELRKLEAKSGLVDDILEVIEYFKADMPFRIARVEIPMQAEGTSSEEDDGLDK